MKFREIFLFEVNFQLKRYTTWIYFIVILGLMVLSTQSLVDNVKRGEGFLNSPVNIAMLTAVGSVLGMLLSAAISGSAAVRDLQTGMDPLMYTTSLKKSTYLGGRFFAVFCVNLAVVSVIMFLLFCLSFVPALEPLFISNDFLSFLSAFLLFAVPNVFIITGIIFSLGILTRSAMAGFFGAALLFFISLMTMDIIAGELGWWDFGKKLDLSGLTVLRELVLIQTPLQMQFDLVSLSSSLMINRLIWIGIATIFLSLAYLRFGFVHHTSGSSKRRGKKLINTPVAENKNWSSSVSAPVDSRIFSLKNEIQQAIFLISNSFWAMIRAKVWLIIPATAAIIIMISEEVLEGQLGVSMVPTTWKVIQLFHFFLAVKITVIILISFYAGELVWKERDSRLYEMADAAPVSNRVLFISKFISLCFMILLVQAIFLFSGIIVQVLQGYYQIDLLLYIQVFFGFGLVDYILFAVLALAAHVLINQKYIGHLVVFILFYYMSFPEQMGLQHNLLIFGSDPGYAFSEISGFEPYVAPWLWFKLYWVGWALLLGIVIYLFWNRGKENLFSRRLKEAKFQVPKTAKFGIPSIVLIFIVGGFLFYNTNILNSYTTSEERIEQRAFYEKNYGKYKFIPQPMLSAVKIQVEIYPEKGELEVMGNYKLINKTSIALDTIHVATTPGMETVKMDFSRKSEEIIIDNILGHRIYKLNSPLQPGDSLSLNFTVRYSQTGISNLQPDRTVVSNGTYFGFHNLPAIGYEADREISSEENRKKYGLPPRPEVASVFDMEARMNINEEEVIDFDAEIGTAADQTAVTAGTLQRSWLKNNRKYFHYKTDASIRHNYEILSAVYEVHKAHWENVDIQIFHHPAHTKNLKRMVHGIQSSLAYFTENFSSYPHSQINLAEFPSTGVGLNGNPVTMTYSEGFSHFDIEKYAYPMDFPFAVIGHEVAHQWWGNELRPAYVEGSALLTESLAWYSSMMVMEKTFGPEHLARLLRVMRQEYLTPRSAADAPLFKATDRFSAYRRGPFAMFALKEYVGEENINLALKRLLQKFGNQDPPLPASTDLLVELRIVTPDSLQYLLKDLLEKNTFWELKADKATVEAKEKGTWNVSFNIETRKVTVDKEGVETEIPMNDYIDIGIYANSPEDGIGDNIYLKRHQLKTGKQTITVQVFREPDLAGIDPNRLLIDQNIYDNFIEIKRNDNKSKEAAVQKK